MGRGEQRGQASEAGLLFGARRPRPARDAPLAAPLSLTRAATLLQRVGFSDGEGGLYEDRASGVRVFLGQRADEGVVLELRGNAPSLRQLITEPDHPLRVSLELLERHGAGDMVVETAFEPGYSVDGDGGRALSERLLNLAPSCVWRIGDYQTNTAPRRTPEVLASLLADDLDDLPQTVGEMLEREDARAVLDRQAENMILLFGLPLGDLLALG